MIRKIQSLEEVHTHIFPPSHNSTENQRGECVNPCHGTASDAMLVEPHRCHHSAFALKKHIGSFLLLSSLFSLLFHLYYSSCDRLRCGPLDFHRCGRDSRRRRSCCCGAARRVSNSLNISHGDRAPAQTAPKQLSRKPHQSTWTFVYAPPRCSHAERYIYIYKNTCKYEKIRRISVSVCGCTVEYRR